ncbi:hypothetical protein LPJ60_006586, partial [Coemansia sp. RSA 2675]
FVSFRIVFTSSRREVRGASPGQRQEVTQYVVLPAPVPTKLGFEPNTTFSGMFAMSLLTR